MKSSLDRVLGLTLTSLRGYVRQRTRSNDDFTVRVNNLFIAYFHIVNHLVYIVEFSLLSRVDTSASEIETYYLFTMMQMPFETLNYNGDVLTIVLNDVMHVHDQHFRRACHVTVYCYPVKNVLLA